VVLCRVSCGFVSCVMWFCVLCTCRVSCVCVVCHLLCRGIDIFCILQSKLIPANMHICIYFVVFRCGCGS
jgi:hypothetical protein